MLFTLWANRKVKSIEMFHLIATPSTKILETNFRQWSAMIVLKLVYDSLFEFFCPCTCLEPRTVKNLKTD